jgi:hypothetical protein
MVGITLSFMFQQMLIQTQQEWQNFDQFRGNEAF